VAQLVDKSEEICGLCRFRIQDEELVKARYVKKEITAAFDEKRAYPFFADSSIIDSLKSGANHEVYTSSFIALKNRAFDELAENDYSLRSRLANDARLTERVTNAISILHRALASYDFKTLPGRRFVIVKELPGKPTVYHISRETTVFTHVGQGPFWLEIPTLYLGLKTFDAVDSYLKRGDDSLFKGLVSLLMVEERAIETGFAHIDVYPPEVALLLHNLVESVIDFSEHREIGEFAEISDVVPQFTDETRGNILELLDAREKMNEMNFDYEKNLSGVEELIRLARIYKKHGERKYLHEVVRLLVSASGHDLHEIRNRANIALERIFSPKEYDAPLAENFLNAKTGEEFELEFNLSDKIENYFLRVYNNLSDSEFPVESEISYEDFPLSTHQTKSHKSVKLRFENYGHRDYCVVYKNGSSFEWVEGEGLNGRINVIPDLAGEICLEIFVDIHGHTGTYWKDEKGHPGLVYNENGEVIRLGRFSDIADHLDDLKERYYVTSLYLLGVFKRGENSQDWAAGATSPSPFSPMSLHEIEPSLGGAKEFKDLIKKAHKLGIKIIVDCIPHLNRYSDEVAKEDVVYCYGGDGQLVARASTDGRYGSWDDGKLFNYRRYEVWEWLAGSVDRLIEEYDIDGIRFDSAHAVPIMMKKNNYPYMYGKRRTAEEMVEGRIIVNDRWDEHFITTGYFDSQCRDTIAIPVHQYMMFRVERALRRKKKNFFINIAECFWGHERFLSRSGIIPYNSTLFKVSENIIHGKSDVREIYHIYDNYYPSVLCKGTELVGILGNHDERRAMNTFGDRGLKAAAGLISFLSNIIMDYEGGAEGEGWKVYLDNIYVNWNQFESNSNRGIERYYRELYSFHRNVRGKGHLIWANNNMVAAAVKAETDGRNIWVAAFNFADSNQSATLQFDNQNLPIEDDAFYRVVDPLYSPITGHYNYYTGRELKTSRINVVVSYTQRAKFLRFEKTENIGECYIDFLKDSFYRLCSISRNSVFPSNFAFNEFASNCSDYITLSKYISENLIPAFWENERHYLELGIKRILFHMHINNYKDKNEIYSLFIQLSESTDKKLAELGKAIISHNNKGSWVFMSAEADPFSKSGGLANVVFELPRELSSNGEEVYVITPYYRNGDSKSAAKMKAASDKYGVKYTGVNVRFKILDADYEVGVHSAVVDGVKYFLLDHHELFDGLYWGVKSSEKITHRVGFARACAEVICTFGLKPYFTFTNDAYIGPFNGIVRSDHVYNSNPNFQKTTFFHIIHNGGWQYFDAYARYESGFDIFRLFNLPDWRAHEFMDPVHTDRVNCMASGIRFADKVVTVSPSYAKQIEYQCDGLEKILSNVKGISNAVGRDLKARIQKKFDGVNFVSRNYPRFIDYLKNDKDLKSRIEKKYPEILLSPNDVYSITDEIKRYTAERAMNKMLLQFERGLDVDFEKPLFVMIHRITEQKGFQLLLNASEGIFRTLGWQGIIGGGVSSGDEKGEEIAHGLWMLGQYYSRNASVSIGFQEVSVPLLSADLFLMPSMNEPGGISQIEAFVCGTLVLARATGGLRDTVFPVRKTGNGIEGNGFLFTDFNPTAFYDAMERASAFFKNSGDEVVYQARKNAEKSVYFWDRPAKEYVDMAYGIKEIIRPENGKA